MPKPEPIEIRVGKKLADEYNAALRSFLAYFNQEESRGEHYIINDIEIRRETRVSFEKSSPFLIYVNVDFSNGDLALLEYVTEEFSSGIPEVDNKYTWGMYKGTRKPKEEWPGYTEK